MMLTLPAGGRGMRLYAAILAVVAALACAGVAAADAPSPRDVVVDTSARMIKALQDNRELIKQDPQRVYALVEDILLPHFDFNAMSKWVLGKHWRKLSKAQSERFTREFRTLLVRTYAVSLADYKDQPYVVLPEQAGGQSDDRVVVRTEVKVEGPYPLPINYSMHRKDGVWTVFDVTVDGVSLVTNYRTTFTNEINQGGPEMLINKLVSLNRDQGQ